MNKCFAGGHLRYVDGAWRDDNGDTVDVEPVRHGEWLLNVELIASVWTCSECDYTNFFGRTRYCPNCGAKMDGKVDKNEN